MFCDTRLRQPLAQGLSARGTGQRELILVDTALLATGRRSVRDASTARSDTRGYYPVRCNVGSYFGGPGRWTMGVLN